MNKKPKRPKAPAHVPVQRFAAIDFETADYGRDSACAVAVIIAEGGTIVHQEYALIRPPRKSFVFTYLHGISWADVAQKPAFDVLWPKLSALLDNVDFIAAHNASFDRGVVAACCAAYGCTGPNIRYVCTMKLARHLWNIRPTKLSDVCAHFNFKLNHHDALSDALNCAKIVLEAQKSGVPHSAFLK